MIKLLGWIKQRLLNFWNKATQHINCLTVNVFSLIIFFIAILFNNKVVLIVIIVITTNTFFIIDLLDQFLKHAHTWNSRFSKADFIIEWNFT